MLVKCTKCNAAKNIRGTSGTKISDYTCICGGKYKAARGCTLIGINPLYPDDTYEVPYGVDTGKSCFRACRVGKSYFIMAKSRTVFYQIEGEPREVGKGIPA
jgi:hypothetical protein